MKFTFFAAALSVAMLVGCSHVQDSKRIPASVKDVGVIGPDGDVILFYREGDYIIVKNCDPYTILELTPAQARSNCQGKANKVPVESFKQAIRSLVSTHRLNVLMPLTPEEVQAYAKDGLSSDQMEAMVIELDKIYAFITTYGAENANLVRTEELVKALCSQETRENAIKKINSEVEKALNLITDQTKLTLTKFNSDKDQFLYTVLKNFNPSLKFPCGLQGSVDDRIRDCSSQLTSQKEGFQLVTRTEEFKEVHKDTKTGLLWGDRLPSTMSHDNAEKACMADLAEVAKISEFAWRLPSKEEYEEAEKNGIRKALPNMNYWFWSSSVNLKNSSEAWVFQGNYGRMDYIFRYDFYQEDISTRCVAR
ncbi:MAG: DUF1566 domain-containing protein [Bacteriovoracaceae bacterium]